MAAAENLEIEDSTIGGEFNLTVNGMNSLIAEDMKNFPDLAGEETSGARHRQGRVFARSGLAQDPRAKGRHGGDVPLLGGEMRSGSYDRHIGL